MLYADYLKNILKPLGLYDMDEGASGAEADAIGAALDSVNAATEELEGECVIPTASGYGLDAYTAILPQRPAAANAPARRRALCAMLSIDGESFSRPALNRVLAGCGTAVEVRETDEPNVVTVRMPQTRGVPENFDELKRRIESILPCHIEARYELVYSSLGEIERSFISWRGIENGGFTWSMLENFAAQEV